MSYTQATVELAIMFVDIPGSIQVYGQHSDGHARNILAEYLETIKSAIKSSQGTVVKEIGDELLCNLPSADEAARAAINLQENCKARFGEKRMGIRVAIHLGKVIMDEGEMVGESVNIATILIGFAKEDQILLSDVVASKLTRRKNEIRKVAAFPIRGRNKTMEVHELMWGDDATVTEQVASPMPQCTEESPLVKLTYGPFRRWVNAEHPAVTMGRGDKNDILLKNDLASRQHAQFIFRNGQFFLVDSSTNGLSFVNQKGEQRFVHRDEILVSENGTITVGRQKPNDETDAIIVTFIDVS